MLLLSSDASEVQLCVEDDGAGFDATGAFPGHLGLRSMRERVARLDGILHIESAPQKGTRRFRANSAGGTKTDVILDFAARCISF